MMTSQNAYVRELSPSIHLHCLNSPRYAVAGIRFARVLRDLRPTAILSTNIRTDFWGLLGKKISNVPARYIVRLANTPSQQLISTDVRNRVMTRFFLKYATRKADRVIAPSKGVALDLASVVALSPEKVQVIYNPVNLEQVEHLSKEPIEHAFFKDSNSATLLSVGRLVKQKNHVIIVNALSKIRNFYSAKLIILGDGPLREAILSRASELELKECVDLPGFDPNPFRYMARASVFVLSSFYEGFPNVLVQAIACGCPVVSTDCPSGPQEILDGGKYGYLVPVNDEEALAEALLRTLKGEVKPVPPEWLEQFRAEKIGEQYLNLLLPER